MKKLKKVYYSKRYEVSEIVLLNSLVVLILILSFIIACDLHAIRSILQANRNLLNGKIFGYEGSDVYGIIKNVRIFIVNTFGLSLFTSFSSSRKRNDVIHIQDKRKTVISIHYMLQQKRDIKI
jgi:hypothetical protein